MKRNKMLIFILSAVFMLSFTLSNIYIYNETKKNNEITIAELKKSEEKKIQEESEKKIQEEKLQEEIKAKEAAEKDKAGKDKIAKDKAAVDAAIDAIVKNPKSANYREFFKQDLFMGDSISEGLFYYEYLDEKRVIAKKGMSLTSSLTYADKIVALKPERIFILYGVNNMDDRTPSKVFVNQYLQLIKLLKQKIPKAQIYLQSITPVNEEIVHKTNTHINNTHINECNEGLKVMATEQAINFINIGSILNDTNKDLYEVDGIHFVSKFYPIWLNYIESSLALNHK